MASLSRGRQTALSFPQTRTEVPAESLRTDELT